MCCFDKIMSVETLNQKQVEKQYVSALNLSQQNQLIPQVLPHRKDLGGV